MVVHKTNSPIWCSQQPYEVEYASPVMQCPLFHLISLHSFQLWKDVAKLQFLRIVTSTTGLFSSHAYDDWSARIRTYQHVTARVRRCQQSALKRAKPYDPLSLNARCSGTMHDPCYQKSVRKNTHESTHEQTDTGKNFCFINHHRCSMHRVVSSEAVRHLHIRLAPSTNIPDSNDKQNCSVPLKS